MSVSLKELGDNIDPKDFISKIRDVLNDLEEQLNQRANVYVSTTGRVPKTIQPDDLLVTGFRGLISFYLKTKTNYLKLNASMLGGLLSQSCSFKGIIQDTIAPALTHFPNVGDFGIFVNTTGPTYYFCANINNLLKKTTLT